MSELFPNFLRGAVSSTTNVLLMLTLIQPKYSKRVTNLAMVFVLAADLTVSACCYLSGRLTLLAKLDVALFTILYLVINRFFKTLLCSGCSAMLRCKM